MGCGKMVTALIVGTILHRTKFFFIYYHNHLSRTTIQSFTEKKNMAFFKKKDKFTSELDKFLNKNKNWKKREKDKKDKK